MEVKTQGIRSAILSSRLYGSLIAAMQLFVKRDPRISYDVTHVEILFDKHLNNQTVKELIVCASIDEYDEETDDEEFVDMGILYKSFYEWFYPLYLSKIFPDTEHIVIKMGFNYRNPGIIMITNEECTYDSEDDLVNHVSSGHLSQVVGHNIHLKYSEMGIQEFYGNLEEDNV